MRYAACLRWQVLRIRSALTSTVNTKRRSGSGSDLAIRTTGRFSHPPLHLIANPGTSSLWRCDPGR